MKQVLLAMMASTWPMTAPIGGDRPEAIVSGVVGQQVTVTLPVSPGEAWEVLVQGGRRVHGFPYRFRMGSAGPEIWTFPLLAPGRSEVAFRLVGPDAASTEGTEKRVVIRALTPFEAQQVAPGSLHGTLLRP